jgi:hypothetical protein
MFDFTESKFTETAFSWSDVAYVMTQNTLKIILKSVEIYSGCNYRPIASYHNESNTSRNK